MKQATLPRLTMIALAASAALAARPALADDGTPQDLGVVQVTGQSRTQQLQDVPITLRAVDAATIKSVAATNMAGLDGLVPGLTVDASEPTQPEFSIRGLSNGDFGIGTDSPVGVYQDGVYTGKTGGSLLGFNDVKRVEVLKGPQGTLFGRNSAAGAVSIITNDPSTSGPIYSGLMRFGNEGGRHVEVLANQPLSDSLALRFSAVSEHTDGWIKNTVDGTTRGGTNDWGTRLALRWSDDDTSAILSWEHESLSQASRPIFSLVAAPTFPVNPSTWINPLNEPLADDANPAHEARLFNGVTLRVNHSLDFAEFTSTSAFRQFTSTNREDNNGLAAPAAYLGTGNEEYSKSWQQEFKLNGTTGNFDWVTGVSAYYEQARQHSIVDALTDSIDQVLLNNPEAGVAPFATTTGLAQLVGIPGINLLGQSWEEQMINTAEFKAVAAYGDVIWKLSSDTNLTGGVRFTRDSKSFSWYNPLRSAPGLDAQLAELNQLGLFPTLVGAGAISAEQAAGLQYLMTNNIEFSNPLSTTAPVSTSSAWTNTSPRLVIDHHLSKDTMVFASVTRGYQAGGFNAVVVNAAYQPEIITNYEAGIKGGIRDAGLFYTASLFHYNFTNLQNIVLVPSSTPGGVPSYQVMNSDQQATGADLEAFWQIDHHWRLNGSTELINQTYSHYTSPEGVDLAGQAVGTPRVNATLGVDAKFAMAGGTASSDLNWVYAGPQRCNANAVNDLSCVPSAPFTINGAQQHVDLRLGWDAPQKKWGVALITTNLFNQRYVQNVSTEGAAVGSPYAFVTPPRRWQIELSASM